MLSTTIGIEKLVWDQFEGVYRVFLKPVPGHKYFPWARFMPVFNWVLEMQPSNDNR